MASCVHCGSRGRRGGRAAGRLLRAGGAAPAPRTSRGHAGSRTPRFVLARLPAPTAPRWVHVTARLHSPWQSQSLSAQPSPSAARRRHCSSRPLRLRPPFLWLICLKLPKISAAPDPAAAGL